MFEKLSSLVKNAQRICLAAHVSPDGDALGSCAALGLGLAKLGKEVTLLCDDPIPPRYAFLGVQTQPFDAAMKVDLCIYVDCSDVARAGKAGALVGRVPTFCIDHHGTNPAFADENVIDPAMAAAAQLVLLAVDELGIPWDARMASCLYVGLSTDSGNFTFSNCDAKTLLTASYLVEKGARPAELCEKLYRNRPLSAVRLLGLGLATLQMSLEGKVASLHVTRDMMADSGARDGDTEDMVNYAADLEGVEIAVFVREAEGGTKASLRSRGEADVSKLASYFGGGGHAKAAGCFMKLGVAEAEAALVKKACEMLTQ